MKRLITFDTMILRELRTPNKISEMLSKVERDGTICLTQLVLDEFVEFYKSILLTETIHHSYILQSVYEDLDITFLRNEAKSGERIRKIISDFFNNQIITHKNIDLEDIYTRALQKIPPFTKQQSDKGLKDTMLWLSLLNHDLSEFDEIVLVSKDNSFIQNTRTLTAEFESHVSKSLKIFDSLTQYYEYLSDSKTEQKMPIIPNETKNQSSITIDNTNVLRTVENYRQLAKYRVSLKDTIDNLIFVEVDNPYGNYSVYHAIQIYSQLKVDSFESFFVHLDSVVNKNILSNDVNPYELFSIYLDENDVKVNSSISNDNVINLLELLAKFRNELPEYLESFIEAIVNQINKQCLITRPSEEDYFNYSLDDLPF